VSRKDDIRAKARGRTYLKYQKTKGSPSDQMDGLSSDILKPTARPALMPSFQEDVEKHSAEEVVVDDGGQCLPSLSASRFGPIPTRAISLGPRPTARPALMPSIQEAVEEHLDSCAAGQPSRYGPVPTQSLSRAVSLADDHPDAVQSSQWAVENNELFMSTMPTYTVFQLIFTYAHGSSQKNYLNAPDPGCKQ
jgi:hypothetical protein